MPLFLNVEKQVLQQWQNGAWENLCQYSPSTHHSIIKCHMLAYKDVKPKIPLRLILIKDTRK